MGDRGRLLLLAGGVASAALATAGLVAAAKHYGGRKRRLPVDVTERVIVHMNKDHSNSVLHFAKHYGKVALANAATIVAMDYEGLELSVTTASESSPIAIRVDFKKPLKDPKEAKEVLIEMAKTAAEALGAAFKGEESLVGLDPETDTTWGLAREEMGKKPLVGTVKRYDTHLFVIWKTPADWPKNADQGDEASLPVALAKALSERKNSIVGKVKVNVAEGVDGDIEGAIICFPQEIMITGVTAETAGAVMDALLVQGSVDDVEKVQGVSVSRNVPPHHVFVCSHIKRDKRCGLIGPYLSKQLTRLIKEKGLSCPVRSCSHVGGHTYAGNVLCFSRRAPDGSVVGDWYGYVTPLAAKDIVERTLQHGEILMSVWRGQMGLSEADQENLATELRRSYSASASCNDCSCHKTDL